MPKVAALEFEDNLVRVLVAKTTGTSVQVSSAFEVSLESNWEDSESEFGKELAGALGNKIGRCDALVSFGRGQSELRVITVPVVPDDELPEIVRFQAIRQFTNATDESPVDFLPLSESGDEKKVLAATVPQEAIEKLKDGCQTAGLAVKEMKLRATCTTALSQSVAPDRKNYIIVEPTDQSFNVEVVAYGKLCLTRTVRSAGHDSSEQIVREIRRTLAAANNQIQGYEAKGVVVFGDENNFSGLRESIENDLHFDVEFINPFDHISGLKSLPENPGHYASLVGLLMSHCKSTTETIDFLNPRKKEKDGGKSRMALLAGVGAALVFVTIGILGYVILASKSAQIAEIEAKIKGNAEGDNIAKELIANVEKIEDFENSQAIWLKELANVSQRTMDPDQVILNNLSFSLDLAKKDGSIKITANGYLQSGEISEQIGNEIRENEKYEAKLENVFPLTEKEKNQDLYTHKFTARVNRPSELIIPDVPEELVKTYMAPRIEVGTKELEALQKAKKKDDDQVADDKASDEEKSDGEKSDGDNSDKESQEISKNEDQKEGVQ